jgi:hypothetical protein
MASSPAADQHQPQATDSDAALPDSVVRVEGILKSRCCFASIIVDGRLRGVCNECDATITTDLDETLDLLGVRNRDPNNS